MYYDVPSDGWVICFIIPLCSETYGSVYMVINVQTVSIYYYNKNTLQL